MSLWESAALSDLKQQAIVPDHHLTKTMAAHFWTAGSLKPKA